MCQERLLMGITGKLKTAYRIFKQKGVGGVWRTIRQKLNSHKSVDENAMIFEILSTNLARGIMVDVGAHHGYSLLPFAEAQWQVFAFEPDPENRSKLLENTDKFVNVHVDSRAVSDEVVESASFYTSKESSGISSLVAFLPSHEVACEVCTTTLSQFIQEQNLDRIDFLKIDTEGFDLKVLQGLSWEQLQPAVILCEFEDSKTQKLNYTFQTLADYLVSKGYHVIVSEWRPIVKYGEQHSWRGFYTYPYQLVDEKGWGNLIATNDDAIYQQLLNKCKLSA